MRSSVRALHDLPLLYVTGGAENMAGPRKTRAELLNKIVQFIWDYQDRHGGATPSITLVEQNIDALVDGGGGYYMRILADEGRLNKISSRPFRVTLTGHPENKRAIASFKRLRERIERADELERERVREEQERQRVHEEPISAPQVRGGDVVVAEARPMTDVVERALVEPRHDHHVPEVRAMQRFTEAHNEVREANREMRPAIPKLLRIADERDLVFELVSRGYRVDKVR